ncbi:nascent polypeptide-associated complex subunit alpha, muscle-specific form-like isoform X2 [Ischnura elegans]|uniref:nascent polypeptide-associated complex subunit alpha, muscle-specific form-like isoform X2 n=1 Tax=Ischnura elegans TaxID=197161 RepID=UPI001ED88744|nr:nascent polypeptide-associated complex subunit alpha, muscle-specific form-like isoform X2 [Ischnura elegans]
MTHCTGNFVSDVGEVDSFLGQDALPSIPLPGVLPPELKKPSAEQLQPITFYNAQGQPTGGAGLDFLSPVGVTPKSSESTFLSRHKQFAARRRPVVLQSTTSSSSSVSSLPPVPSPSLSNLKSQPAQLVAASSEPPSIETVPLNPLLSSSKLSPLLQEPSLVSKTVILPPKSQSTPPSPSVQLPLTTSSNQQLLAVSKSQPTTASPSPSHKPQATSLVSQDLSPPSEEPSSGETWTSLLTSDKEPPAPPSRYSIVQSIVAELFSATDKTEKSSLQTQVVPKPVSDSVPFDSNTSAQFPEVSSAQVSAPIPPNLFGQGQNYPSKDLSSSAKVADISSSSTGFKGSTDLSGSQTSNYFDSYNSKFEESRLTSQTHSSATVSLISPSTAEALANLSVGKRLSCSEEKPEEPISDSAEDTSLSNQQQNSLVTASKSESLSYQDSSYNEAPISSVKGVTFEADKTDSTDSISIAEQDTLTSTHILSPENKTLITEVSEASVVSKETNSQVYSKVEHIETHKSTAGSLSHISDLQLVDSHPEKGENSEASLQDQKSLISTNDLVSESKEFSAKLESVHFSVQQSKTDTHEPVSDFQLATEEATPPNTDSTQSSQKPEARLPTTSELNSSNPQTPLHSHTTQPNPSSSYQGTHYYQPTPNQYPHKEQHGQLPIVHQEKSPGPAEQSQFPLNQPFQSLPNQPFTPANQNPSPICFNPTYQITSAEDRQYPPRLVYQSPYESNQLGSIQGGHQIVPDLQVNPSVQTPAPLFFTPPPVNQPPVSQPIHLPPQRQIYDPVATTPLSHYTTSTSIHRQGITGPYLIPTSQATQPAAQIFVPTTPPGQSSLDQPSTPLFKTSQTPIPSHTPPNGFFQSGAQPAFLPPRPPSNPSLPPPPHQLPLLPGQPLPPPPLLPHASPTLGQSITNPPHLPRPASQNQYPPGTPTLRPTAASLPPPPPKSNSASSPHVNQYSIHAKTQHSRRPYIAPVLHPQQDYFHPSFQPPLPLVQQAAPPVIQQASPVTFLVPDQSSAPVSAPPISAAAAPPPASGWQSKQQGTYLVPDKSQSSSPLSLVPLTPATTPPVSHSGVVSASDTARFQLPSPAVPQPLRTPTIPPPPAKQGGYNPFSARATPPPPSSQQQKQPVESVSWQPPPSTFCQPQIVPLPSSENCASVPLTSPAESSVSVNQLGSSAPPPSVVANSAQSEDRRYSGDLTHSVDSLNFVPYNTSAPPPSSVPEGGQKNYRLGKQRPRYAQVPDLAVSPLAVSPVYPPSSSETVYSATPTPAAAEPYSIYPPGAQQLIASEEFLVPTDNSLSDQSEGYPASLFNLASQPGSAAAAASGGSNTYRPVYCHWFFKKEEEPKPLWKPFSHVDSQAIETAFNDGETNESTLVPTDGGRYDVCISKRQRTALFWEEKKPTEVRRCSWFYKGPLDSRYTPYDEDFATKLENEYKVCMEANKWNRKIEHNGETVVLHGPVVMVHYSPTASPDQLGVTADTSPVKPRVVKRGVEEFEIEEGEPAKVDHLLFLVHGIGSVCDLRFRDVVETVDDFRSLALQLTRTHFSLGVDKNQVNRVEVLPVSWHWKLHGEDTGIDRKLNSITLKSIPRLRNFTNDTLLDILFYTSPVYCQTIMDTVGNEMNRMYELFLKRNPGFQGSVSVGGHSLGSLILFDLLYHQKVPKNPRSSPSIIMTGPGTRPPDTSPNSEKPAEMKDDGEAMEEDDFVSDEDMAMAFSRSSSSLNRRASRVNYMMGTAGTGQPHISYPQLNFKPENFFALGSPIGMFVTVRGIETLGDNFRLPTCPGFFNIFHPFDPVAYRIESLIDPELAPTLKPVTIPHHKGRKRMHLELKENLARMGSDLKNKLVDSVKNTWSTMTQYSIFSRPEPTSQPTVESEVTKALEAHLGPATVSAPVDIGADTESESGDTDADVTLGCLNRGRRVDYVLQEAPLESFNEYLFALQSHVCYWESEDTLLMILTEIYSSNNVKPDSVITGVDREKSPMRLLSDQFLASASPPKFSALRFPSSTSLSSEGSTSSQGVSRSQSVPKTLNDPNLAMLSTSSPGYLESLGQSPQMGMDPTAPMSEVRNLAPPPTIGFVKQSLQRK